MKPSGQDLAGRTAIVTGGATKIGHGVVAALCDAGAKAVVADIDEIGAKEIVGAYSDVAAFVRTDITDDDAISACVATTLGTFGSVDILVNLACSYEDDGAASTRAQWRSALDVNLVSAALFAEAVRPCMAARGGGAIVNFGSISAKVAQTGRWLYPVEQGRDRPTHPVDGHRLRDRPHPGELGQPRLDLVEGHGRAHRIRPRQDRPGSQGLPSARPRGGSRGSRRGGRLPVQRACVLHHRGGLGRRRWLLRNGARTSRSGHPQARRITKRSITMRDIVIVGAGQAGLQLGIGLLDAGYDVTVVSNRTPEQIRDGQGDVQPVHVRQRARPRARARAELLG